jgi:hypothetical protein
MSTFAETANVVYCLSFAYKAKQTFVFHNKWKSAVSVFSFSK